MRLFLRFKLKTRYDIKALKGIRGPAFIVCPHVSNIDFLLVAVALLPHRPTFVVSQHFMTHPKIRWILEKMHVIPKKMFCPDIKTILSIMRAKESGNLIVLFPEGRLTCFGHSLQVTVLSSSCRTARSSTACTSFRLMAGMASASSSFSARTKMRPGRKPDLPHFGNVL